jgi:hypothetical protein
MRATTIVKQLAFVTVAVGALLSCKKEELLDEPVTSGKAVEAEPTRPAAAGAVEAGPVGGAQPALTPPPSSCPMAVPGSAVALDDRDDGVSLTFTTERGDVAELRQRVRFLAEMYAMHQGHGYMRWHHMAGGHGWMHGRGQAMGPIGMGPMPASRADVVDVDRGARLDLTPIDAADLDHLRQHVRWQSQRMGRGECWTLETEASGAGGGS